MLVSPHVANSPAPPAPIPFGEPKLRLVAPEIESADLTQAIRQVGEYLLALQRPDGHWCAELEGDTILETEFILLQTFLGRSADPRIAKCAHYILSRRESNGGWAIYPGGPAEISATVKAYFALKIAGYAANEPMMRQTRDLILELGGAERVKSFTRFTLACLGQVPYSHCPTVPVELALLPKWVLFSLWNMSSWTRTIVVPLAIVQFFQPVTPLPAHLGIAELFHVAPRARQLPPAACLQGRPLSWGNAFRLADRCAKALFQVIPKSWRQPGLNAAKKWMFDRFEGSDGLGAIFPPMVYTIMALRVLGYPDDAPEMIWAEKQLDDLIIETEDSIRLQPCVSPVWDTAITMLALAEAGLPADDPRLTKAADWLLAREIREPGDWHLRGGVEVEPSGWAFEYNNRFYADVDDTAMVLMALWRSARFPDPDMQAAVDRALRFLNHMQCSDHGWAAFDRDINNPILERVPFADHNAMLDPSCPDITARILEMYGRLGYRRGRQPNLDRAVEYLFRQQEPEGCWYGRWGVNYIYGTWQVLTGLNAIGYDMQHPRIRRAVQWFLQVQNEDGGWGESCASYDDRTLMGQGVSTPSQTAWALMGLMEAGEWEHAAVVTGIRFLLHTQNPDGSWDQEVYTGTGFPKVFYLQYHYYKLAFPLMALGRYRNWLLRRQTQEPVPS